MTKVHITVEITLNVELKTSATIRYRFNDFETSLSFFNELKQIDLVLEAGILFELLSQNKIYLGKNLPVLVETKFVWIFTGTIKINFGKK